MKTVYEKPAKLKTAVVTSKHRSRLIKINIGKSGLSDTDRCQIDYLVYKV